MAFKTAPSEESPGGKIQVGNRDIKEETLRLKWRCAVCGGHISITHYSVRGRTPSCWMVPHCDGCDGPANMWPDVVSVKMLAKEEAEGDEVWEELPDQFKCLYVQTLEGPDIPI